MKRLLAFLRRLFHRPPARIPLRTNGLMTDWEFMRGLSRQGEPFDPLSATIEE